MMYINKGIVNPIQLFNNNTIPGTINITHDAYKGGRQHLKMPIVTSLSALYAFVTAIIEMMKKGIPIIINTMPAICSICS